MDRYFLSTQAGWRTVPSANEHAVAFMQSDAGARISAQSTDGG
jgi:hypothetical protein